MVAEINEKFPELIEYKDAHGQTPVHYAAGIDNSTLQVLLRRQSCTAPYIQDTEGRTPAHIAAQQNNVHGLKLLMDQFPDSCEILDNKGRNIAHYAAFLGRIEALDYFLKDAQYSNLVNKKDNDGNTPLHLLSSSLTELPIASLRRIQQLIPKLKKLQLKTYNIKDLTPGDIANSFKIFELEPAYQEVVKDFRKVAPKGGRVKHWLQPLQEHKVDIEAQRKDSASNMLRTAKTHMVVATLIATVSFAAGLGVPGGFNQDSTDNVKGGTAMLNNKIAFRVFLISDCIALASSLTAIICYFWIAIGTGKGSSKALFLWAFEASSLSIIALMVAFMAGIYSILQPSSIVFASCAILILCIYIYFYCIFAMGVIKLRITMKELMGKDHQNLKREVLHGKVETHNPRSSYLQLPSSPWPFYYLVNKVAECYFRRLRKISRGTR